MKKLIFSTIFIYAISILFMGCANDGLAVNTIDGNKVERVFQQSYVTSQQKVVIDNSQVAILTGLGVGAVGGALAHGDDFKGALIGAAIGGIIGALSNNEVEAYKTTLSDGNICYLRQKLRLGTEVEFTVVENKLKNVNVVAYPQ